jgi:hypothetical protein
MMKIGVISRGRTASSAVVNSLTTNNKLSNKFEIYFDMHIKLSRYYQLRPNTTKNIQFTDFQTKLYNLTKSLFDEGNFIVKIWPSMLCFPPHKIYKNQSFQDIKDNFIFDITEYLNIHQYDKLYFLDKDLHHSAISWVYSKKTKIFHKRKNMSIQIPKINLDSADYDTVRFYILEYCLHQKLRQFLLDKQIPFTEISNNFESYINSDMLKIEESQNDYENLIYEYTDLYSYISEWYQVCIENTKDWYFI